MPNTIGESEDYMDENTKVPTHVGIIMDGNRRWAREKGLIPSLGHKAGADNLKKVAEACEEFGIKHLTVFAFSTENWKRSTEEVSYLMNLFLSYAKSFKKRLNEKNYRVRLSGDKSALSKELQEEISYIEEATKNNTGLTINLAINYGGRAEIINATKQIAEEYKNGNIKLEDINEDLLSSKMQTMDSPDPDLIIRTGGEKRLSGFLIWQSAYSEFYFTKVYWPDFNREELEKAVVEYSNRKRNFGK